MWILGFQSLISSVLSLKPGVELFYCFLLFPFCWEGYYWASCCMVNGINPSWQLCLIRETVHYRYIGRAVWLHWPCSVFLFFLFFLPLLTVWQITCDLPILHVDNFKRWPAASTRVQRCDLGCVNNFWLEIIGSDAYIRISVFKQNPVGFITILYL